MALSWGFVTSLTASNRVLLAQLNGSLVLLDLHKGRCKDASAVQLFQGCSYTSSSFWHTLTLEFLRAKWRHLLYLLSQWK